MELEGRLAVLAQESKENWGMDEKRSQKSPHWDSSVGLDMGRGKCQRQCSP